VELEQVRRQDQPEFIDAINRVRSGEQFAAGQIGFDWFRSIARRQLLRNGGSSLDQPLMDRVKSSLMQRSQSAIQR